MSTTVTNTPVSSNLDTRLTPDEVIVQLRTMRSQIEAVAPLSQQQRTQTKQRLLAQTLCLWHQPKPTAAEGCNLQSCREPAQTRVSVPH